MSDDPMATRANSEPREPHGTEEWRRFRRAHPALLAVVGTLLLVAIGVDAWLVRTRNRYEREIVRLREAMTDIERHRADAVVSQEQDKLTLALALLRRQARLEHALHLSITVDSGIMYLERDCVVLRAMPVQVGAERRIGISPDTVRMAPPRGVRSVLRVLGAEDGWDVPAWVYADRGIAPPSRRLLPGAAGPSAIVLDGGVLIYSVPTVGPLNDSGYVLPGSVRARAEDLRAVAPNLEPGVRVYFY